MAEKHSINRLRFLLSRQSQGRSASFAKIFALGPWPRNNKASVRNSGSALLIALIVMGVLMTLSLGVSNLLIGTLRDSRLLLEKTRAFFAAESGIEHALADVKQNPPGFETHVSSPEKNFEYTISATARQFPAGNDYATLRLNESITIPLFRGEKPEEKDAPFGRSNSLASPRLGLAVKHFRVNYYVTPDIALRGGQVDSNLDVLRWKIFGISQTDGAMEVINEFLPADSGNSAESPTCFAARSRCCAPAAGRR